MAGKKRDTSKKRNSILDAAVEAFREDGYENTSMDRIAEVAGASKRTVYNHFAGKEALFQAVVERFMDELSTLKNIPYNPTRSLEQQLATFAEAKLAVFKNPSWVGLLKVALGVFIRYPELAQKTMTKSQAGENSLVVWLQAAIADGKLQVPDVELAAGLFWAMVSGALFWPQVFSNQLDPQCITVLKDELIQTFLCRYRNQED